MRGPAVALLVALAPGVAGATADGPDVYRVVGVADDDMLNLRRGPGTSHEVIVGLPNGRELDLLGRAPNGRELDLLGRAPNGWCLVSMRETPQLQGYVSYRTIGE